MAFTESFISFLSRASNLSTKQIFDLAIRCAQEEDPEFVKSYDWPVNTPESPTQAVSTDGSEEIGDCSRPVNWQNVHFLDAYARTVARRADSFCSADYYDYYDDDEFDDYKEGQYDEYKDIVFINK